VCVCVCVFMSVCLRVRLSVCAHLDGGLAVLLMNTASQQPLAVDSSELLLKTLRNPPEIAARTAPLVLWPILLGLSANRVAGILHWNPSLLLQCLLTMMPPGGSGSDTSRALLEVLHALLAEPLSPSLLQTVHLVLRERRLPLAFVHAFLAKCMIHCQTPVARRLPDHFRLVRLICSFAISLLHQTWFPSRLSDDLLVEMQATAMDYSGNVPESAQLFQLVSAVLQQRSISPSQPGLG
jgi:hypothetical protein